MKYGDGNWAKKGGVGFIAFTERRRDRANGERENRAGTKNKTLEKLHPYYLAPKTALIGGALDDLRNITGAAAWPSQE